MKSTSNYILHVKQQLHFIQNTDVSGHNCLKSRIFIIRAFLHAQKYFYMQYYMTYARERSKKEICLSRTLFKLFLTSQHQKYHLAVTEFTTGLTERQFQCHSQFCKHIHVRDHLHSNLYKNGFTNSSLPYPCEGMNSYCNYTEPESRTENPKLCKRKSKPTQTTQTSCAG